MFIIVFTIITDILTIIVILNTRDVFQNRSAKKISLLHVKSLELGGPIWEVSSFSSKSDMSPRQCLGHSVLISMGSFREV